VAEDAINLAGKGHFSNKIIIDATNPIAAVPPENGVLKYFTTLEESLMERIQKQLPEAKVVKHLAVLEMLLCTSRILTAAFPLCSSVAMMTRRKKTVTDILTSFGWETEDMGKVEAARAIEPLCILWCIPGFIRNQWTHAFKLLKK
jgi:predicted dinucleotide-binding enzyme